MVLKDAKENQNYIISDIVIDENTRRRLESIAVIKGATIKVIFQQKSGTVIQVGDTRLALDKEVTEKIELQKDSSSAEEKKDDCCCHHQDKESEVKSHD